MTDQIAERSKGCFLCKWIGEDISANRKLTNYPGASIDGSSSFPPESKVKHLLLEELWGPEGLAFTTEEVVNKAKG